MIEVEVNNIRLDKYLTDKLDLSRSKIQKLIKSGNILVNGEVVSNDYLVTVDDKIEVIDTKVIEIPDLEPSDIPVDVIYENEDLLVINKKSGMVVHPAPGNYKDTLVNALLGKYKLSNDSIRPGIVHRLDKDTSGLMLVAKNDYAHDKLSKMIQDRSVSRYYLALVEGTFNHETGTIDAPIGRDSSNREKLMVTDINAKNAITHFKIVKRFKNHTLIECKLETGRTHQIRVHMAYIKHPVVGDPLYGKKIKNSEFGQLLHSYKIIFNNPRDNKELEFTVPLPDEFTEIMEQVTSE